MNPEQPADGSEWAHVFAVSEAHRLMHGRKWSEAQTQINNAIALLRRLRLPQPRSDHAFAMLRSWFHGGLGKGRRLGSMDLAVAHIYVHAAMTCLKGRSALSTSRPVPHSHWLTAGLA